MENSIIKSCSFTKSENDANEFYHAQPGISASGLKKMKQSPAHYKYEEIAQTEAMFFGEAYHTFILENERFYKEYKIIDLAKRPDPEKTMGAKVNKIWLDELKASGPTIDVKTHEQLKAMRERLFKHPYAKSLLTGGEMEHSYYCTLDIEANQPIQVRFRPDHVKHEKRIIVDLKTAQSASTEDFPRAAAKYDYQIQAALYSDLMEMITGEPLGYDFFFVAQEKSKPYAFNIYQSSPQFLSIGRYEYETLLMLYSYCEENDRWPGYQIYTQNKYGVNELSLPPYAIRELEFYIHKL